MKLNGSPKPHGFDRFESLVIMTSLQNIVISGAQGLLTSMGSKFLIKISYQAINIKIKRTMFYSLVIFI